MTIRGKAYIAGAFEHPTRKAENTTVAQLHAECAKGALEDAGLSLRDIDGYFCAGDAPGMGGLAMVDYLGLKVRHVDSTDVGGWSYLLHV
ncbi:MAG TPA: thiolase domain-containing protein, partial [Burkholderiaceae bacterium]|nr:thiolase domain-containing protein [Burkholderiaceae bacterium]